MQHREQWKDNEKKVKGEGQNVCIYVKDPELDKGYTEFIVKKIKAQKIRLNHVRIESDLIEGGFSHAKDKQTIHYLSD